MSKRFTDTDKWKKEFFRDLPNDYKLLWIYILDDCDHAGIFHPDIDLINFRLKAKFTKASVLAHFGDAVIPFQNGSKWLIRDFVEFQYGELNPDNRAHKSVLDLLNRQDEDLLNKLLTSPLQGRKDKDKDKDKEQDKVIKESTTLKKESVSEKQRLLRQEYESVEKEMNFIGDFIDIHKPDFSAPYVDLWNLFAEKHSKPICIELKGTRRGKLGTRLKEKNFDFVKILKRVRNQAIAMEANWFNLTWILENDTNYMKVLEGNYYRNEDEKKKYFGATATETFNQPKNLVN